MCRVERAVLKNVTRTCNKSGPLPSSFPLPRRQCAFACLSEIREGYLTPARPSVRERLMDSGEIILAEYQMSGKDCRIIQTRGY